MNSLFTARAAVSKIVIAIIFISTLAFAVSAQTVEPQNQGRHYGEPGFVGEPINLNVVNADIRDILSYITDQYGINFVIDKSVRDVPVTVKVNDVPWNIALDSVLQSQELGVQVNGSILRVADNRTLASEGELFRKRQNNQLDTSPLITEFIKLNYARAKDAILQGRPSAGTTVELPGQTAGGASYTDISGTGSQGATNSSSSSSGGGTEGILPIIQRRLSRRGSIEVDGRSNSLIVTDVATNIAAIKQLIDLLDQPEPQVEIETRIVVANRSFARDIGVQLFAFLKGARGSGFQGGTLDEAPLALPPPPGLPLQGPNGSLLSSIPNTIVGLTTGIFGTAQLSALISAGEQKGQAKIIATPRVTALNNKPAEIKSGTKIPVATIQPGGGGGDPIVTTTYVDVPLRLQVTPQITSVGTVILTVIAENSSLSGRVSGGTPSIDTQSMSTQVTVPDGGTTVVGGVMLDNEGESQDKTPGLGSIPILGNLFKRKSVNRSTQEILFFITPRIYRPDAMGNDTSAMGRPTSTTIVQPVPMGNPPSNSQTITEPAPGTVVLPAPSLERPQVITDPK